MTRKTLTLFDPALVRPALLEAFKKLDPRVQWRNPVMFVVYVGSAFTTALAASKPEGFTAAVALWLWFTELFANFAEAMAGSLAAKKLATATDGTLPTHGPLFVALLAGVVLLVGLLNYVPALALGPVVEHLVLTPR